jgi:hypothetical protein
MYTSMLTVAVMGLTPALAEAGGPSWLTEYSQARKQGRSVGKPLAVFIGSGQKGYEKVSEEGKLSPEARRLLQKHYVCVYLDTRTAAGRRLANQFNIKQGAGVVLSNRKGDYQAFNYSGTLGDDELTDCLKHFSDPYRIARTTVNSPYQLVSYNAPTANTETSPASRTTSAPAYYPPATYGGYGNFGGYGGGFGGGFGGGARGGC